MYTIKHTPPTPIAGYDGHYSSGWFAVRKGGDKTVAMFLYDHPGYNYPLHANDEQGALRDAELFVSLMMEPCT